MIWNLNAWHHIKQEQRHLTRRLDVDMLQPAGAQPPLLELSTGIPRSPRFTRPGIAPLGVSDQGEIWLGLRRIGELFLRIERLI